MTIKVKDGRATVRGGRVATRSNAAIRPQPLGSAARSSHSFRTAWNDQLDRELRAQLDQAAKDEVVASPLVAVIVPVLGRPHRVRPLVESFRSATDPLEAQIYFVAQDSDLAELAAIRDCGLEPIMVSDSERSWAKKINRGHHAVTEPWILLGADDLAFRQGWLDVVRPMLHTHLGVIGTNDLGNRATMTGQHSTHPLVRRIYARIYGTVDERDRVVHDGYSHNFPDTELVATARRRGLYVHRQDCVIEHLHPVWGKGTTDPIYELGQQSFRQDHELFQRRARQFGWDG